MVKTLKGWKEGKMHKNPHVVFLKKYLDVKSRTSIKFLEVLRWILF